MLPEILILKTVLLSTMHYYRVNFTIYSILRAFVYFVTMLLLQFTPAQYFRDYFLILYAFLATQVLSIQKEGSKDLPGWTTHEILQECRPDTDDAFCSTPYVYQHTTVGLSITRSPRLKYWNRNKKESTEGPEEFFTMCCSTNRPVALQRIHGITSMFRGKRQFVLVMKTFDGLKNITKI